jgi:3-dehydroquinate dehydratase/shikimate dehydrogenase
MRAIAVAIGPADTNAALARLGEFAGRADLIELRLDMMGSYDLPVLAAAQGPPLLITNRARAEGGFADGAATERLRPLRQAIELGCAYVDVEADLYPLLGEHGRTRIIVSEHDFNSTPPDLEARFRRLAGLGADVTKIAVTPQRAEEALRPLELLAQAGGPTVAIAMGPQGLISRVAALRFAECAFTYATADDDAGTAPGQIPISRMRGAFRAGSISPATRLFGQFGGGSRSLWLAARVTGLLTNAGCDGVCIPLEPELSSEDSLLRLAGLGFAGFWEVGRGCFGPSGDRTGGRAVDPEEAAGLLGRLA